MQKILLLVAVVTVIVHSIIPHIHHHEGIVITNTPDDESLTVQHHPDDDEHHGIFSFAQLDDDYILAKKLATNFELPIKFIPVVSEIIYTNNFTVNTKTHFGWYKEYPPPDNKIFTLSFRGPPVA